MENVNIGIANLIISNKLKESYFNNELINESKQLTKDFFNVVRNSPALQLEFKIFNNIENKHIENEQIATRYIDSNIKLFEIYSIEEIEVEREKLKQFLSEEDIPVNNQKVELYNAIDNLIRESLNDYEKVDVDKIHESFVVVLNHIKEPKKTLVENVDVEEINEDVIEIAVNKFNEKYASLDENDSNLLKSLIKSSDAEKQELLETYKSETLNILEGITDKSAKDNVEKAIKKINEMVFDRKTVDDNIIELHELKKELI